MPDDRAEIDRLKKAFADPAYDPSTAVPPERRNAVMQEAASREQARLRARARPVEEEPPESLPSQYVESWAREQEAHRKLAESTPMLDAVRQLEDEGFQLAPKKRLFDPETYQGVVRKVSRSTADPLERMRRLELVRQAAEESAVEWQSAAEKRWRAALPPDPEHDRGIKGAIASIAAGAFKTARNTPIAGANVHNILRGLGVSEWEEQDAIQATDKLARDWWVSRWGEFGGGLAASLPAFGYGRFAAIPNQIVRMTAQGVGAHLLHGEGGLVERLKGVPATAATFAIGGGAGRLGELFLVNPAVRKIVQAGLPKWMARATQFAGPVPAETLGFTGAQYVERAIAGQPMNPDEVWESLALNSATMLALRAANRVSPEGRAAVAEMRRMLGDSFRKVAPDEMPANRAALMAAREHPAVEVELAYKAALEGLLLKPEEVRRIMDDPASLPAVLAEIRAVPKTFVQADWAKTPAGQAGPTVAQEPAGGAVAPEAPRPAEAPPAPPVETEPVFHGYPAREPVLKPEALFTGVPAAMPVMGAGGVYVTKSPHRAKEIALGDPKDPAPHPWMSVGSMPKGLPLIDGSKPSPPELLEPFTRALVAAGVDAGYADSILRTQPLGIALREVVEGVPAAGRLAFGNALGDVVRASGYAGVKRYGGLEVSNDIWIADASVVRYTGSQPLDPKTGGVVRLATPQHPQAQEIREGLTKTAEQEGSEAIRRTLREEAGGKVEALPPEPSAPERAAARPEAPRVDARGVPDLPFRGKWMTEAEGLMRDLGIENLEGARNALWKMDDPWPDAMENVLKQKSHYGETWEDADAGSPEAMHAATKEFLARVAHEASRLHQEWRDSLTPEEARNMGLAPDEGEEPRGKVLSLPKREGPEPLPETPEAQLARRWKEQAEERVAEEERAPGPEMTDPVVANLARQIEAMGEKPVLDPHEPNVLTIGRAGGLDLFHAEHDPATGKIEWNWKRGLGAIESGEASTPGEVLKAIEDFRSFGKEKAPISAPKPEAQQGLFETRPVGAQRGLFEKPAEAPKAEEPAPSATKPRLHPDDLIRGTPFEQLPKEQRDAIRELEKSEEVGTRAGMLEEAREREAAVPREERLDPVAFGILERFEKGKRKPLYDREAVAKMTGWESTARRMFPKKNPRDLTPAQRKAAMNRAITEAGISTAFVGDLGPSKGFGMDEADLIAGEAGKKIETGTGSEDAVFDALKRLSRVTPKGKTVPISLKEMRTEDARAAKRARLTAKEVRKLAQERLEEIYRDIREWDAFGAQGEPPHPEFLDRYRALDAAIGYAPQGSPADLAFGQGGPESDAVFREHLDKGTAQRPEGRDGPDDPLDGQRGMDDLETLHAGFPYTSLPEKIIRGLFKDSYIPIPTGDSRGADAKESLMRLPEWKQGSSWWWPRWWFTGQQFGRAVVRWLDPRTGFAAELMQRAGSAAMRKTRRYAMDATRFHKAWFKWRTEFNAASDAYKDTMLDRLQRGILDPQARFEGSASEQRLMAELAADVTRTSDRIRWMADAGMIDPKVAARLPDVNLGDLLAERLGMVPGQLGKDRLLSFLFDFTRFGERRRPHPALMDEGGLVAYGKEHGRDTAADFFQEIVANYIGVKASIFAHEPLKWWWATSPDAAILKEKQPVIHKWFTDNIDIQSGASPKWDGKFSGWVARTADTWGKWLHKKVVKEWLQQRPAWKKITETDTAKAVHRFFWKRDGMGGTMMRMWVQANYLGALGLNPASALRNMGQHLASMSYLGGPGEGQIWWAKGLSSLFLDVKATQGMPGPTHGAEGVERVVNRHALQILKQIGVSEEAFIKSIRQNARTLEQAANLSFGRTWSRRLMFMFSGVEWTNRAIMGMAAYLKARDKYHVTHEQAIRYAQQAVHATQFDYRRGLGGTLYAGNLGHAIFQFGRFGFYQAGLISDLIKRGATGQYDTMGYHKGWGPLFNYLASSLALVAAMGYVGVSMDDSWGPGAAIPNFLKVPATMALEGGSDLLGGWGPSLPDREEGRDVAKWLGVYPWGYPAEKGKLTRLSRMLDLGQIAGPVPQQAWGALKWVGSGFDPEEGRNALAELDTLIPAGMQMKRVLRMTGVGEGLAQAPLPILGSLSAEGELASGVARSRRGDAIMRLTETDAWMRMLGLTTPAVADTYRDIEKMRNRESFQRDTVTEINRTIREEIKRGMGYGAARDEYSRLIGELETELREPLNRGRTEESLFKELWKRASEEKSMTTLERLQRGR